MRNEDRFVRQALLNVAEFCDRILVADHQSTDGTAEVLRELSGQLDHLEVRRIANSAESHALIERYAGTDTWILAIDGDELYDPARLAQFRAELEAGAYDETFRVRPAGLHCDELDESSALGSGYLSPPSRPLVGLLNFGAIESWSGVRAERLHGGEVVFRPGFDWDSWRHLGADPGWDESPFRDLHVCFLRRSSGESSVTSSAGRPNLAETGAFRRDTRGSVERFARRVLGRSPTQVGDTSEWKADKYRRGERVTVDVSPFLARR